MASTGVSVGGIYAEAELDISKFQAAAGQLGAESAGIAGALFLASSGMDGAQRAASALGSGIQTLAQAIGAGAGPALSGLTALGQSAAAALSGGLAAGGDVRAAAAALAQAAVSSAAQGIAGAAGIGRGFASGLASGIRAGRSGVIEAARSAALAAAQAARAALRIHSPSRVTREMGEAFDLGFVRGIEGNLTQIDRAVEAALRMSPPEPVARFNVGLAAVGASASGGMAIDYDRLAYAMSQQPAPSLSMNGREVARINSNNTAYAQNSRMRNIAMRYGRR